MGTQETKPTGTGPGTEQPGPAAAFLNERQVVTGANVAGQPSAGTPAPQGGNPSAPAGSGGQGSPAPSPAPAGEQAQLGDVMTALGKISQRLDAQAQFLSKVDGSVKQTRQDFEARFRNPQPTRNGDDDGVGPPPLDLGAMTNTVARAVSEQIRNEFAPLVRQTAANSVAQRVMQAQQDPQILEMVKELPAHIRVNLAAEVHRLAGDKVFDEPDPMFDSPDPVSEAIELIHYRTVVKAARGKAGAQAKPTESPGTPNLSPVPHQGTHAGAQPQSEQTALAEKVFNVPLGENRMRFPAAIEQELGMS